MSDLDLFELVLQRDGHADQIVSMEHEKGLQAEDTFQRDGVVWVIVEDGRLPEQHLEAAEQFVCRPRDEVESSED
jgi:hypothetical protein